MLYHSIFNSYRSHFKQSEFGLDNLTSLASSVATSAMNGAFQAAANEDTLQFSEYWNNINFAQHLLDNKFNSTEAQKARDFQADEAQKARDYNSPVNQVKLMQEAGLNPNGLDYSGSSAQAQGGSPASSGSPGSTTTPSIQAPQVANPMADVLSAVATQADAKLKESSTHQNYVDAEIKKIKLSGELSELTARTENYLQSARSNKADEDLKRANCRLLDLSLDEKRKMIVERYARLYIDYNRLNLDIASQQNQTIMLKAGVFNNMANFKQTVGFYYNQLLVGNIEKSFHYGSQSHSSSNANTRQSVENFKSLSSSADISGKIGLPEFALGASVSGSFGAKEGEQQSLSNDVAIGQVQDDATLQNERMADLFARTCATADAMKYFTGLGDLKRVEELAKQLKIYEQDIDMFEIFMKSMQNQAGKITLPSEP